MIIKLVVKKNKDKDYVANNGVMRAALCGHGVEKLWEIPKGTKTIWMRVRTRAHEGSYRVWLGHVANNGLGGYLLDECYINGSIVTLLPEVAKYLERASNGMFHIHKAFHVSVLY